MIESDNEVKNLIVLIFLIFSHTVYAGQGAEYVNGYFELWLKAHKFEGFIKKNNGIFFPANGVLLDGEIHQVNTNAGGKLYSVESRISIQFKNGKRLDDFVGGVGDTPNSAFEDSLQNFCLTTLHPIYAELFDHNDLHARKESWNIGGINRRVFLSDWGQRGEKEKVDEKNQRNIECILREEMKSMNLSKDIHWVKLVASSVNGSIRALVVTVDGIKNDQLTKRLLMYKWPQAETFFIVKLFFTIGSI